MLWRIRRQHHRYTHIGIYSARRLYLKCTQSLLCHNEQYNGRINVYNGKKGVKIIPQQIRLSIELPISLLRNRILFPIRHIYANVLQNIHTIMSKHIVCITYTRISNTQNETFKFLCQEERYIRGICIYTAWCGYICVDEKKG